MGKEEFKQRKSALNRGEAIHDFLFFASFLWFGFSYFLCLVFGYKMREENTVAGDKTRMGDSRAVDKGDTVTESCTNWR